MLKPLPTLDLPDFLLRRRPGRSHLFARVTLLFGLTDAHEKQKEAQRHGMLGSTKSSNIHANLLSGDVSTARSHAAIYARSPPYFV